MHDDQARQDREADTLTRVVEEGDLDEISAAYGIALKVISDGRQSLSPKQEELYAREVEPLLELNAPAETTSEIDPDQ